MLKLDRISEREIFEEFVFLCQGKPTILLTHRLNSIAIADRVLLLDAGKQLGFDAHDHLCGAIDAIKSGSILQ